MAGLLCVGANLLSVAFRSDCGLAALVGPACPDGIARVGFPLQYSEEGGFVPRHVFSLPALLVDIGVGLAVGVAAGWAAQWWPPRRA